ncbi:Ger(x)C family spore germination C-terminal domain-containing protein [Caldicellulosiruptor naganoensis]
MAVFDNFKLIGYLNYNETRGLLWTLNKIKSEIYPIVNKNIKVSLELTHSTCKITAKDFKDKVLFKIEIVSEVNLGEKEKGQITQKNLEELKKEFIKSISKDINETLKKSFDLKADILHLQDFYYLQHKKQPKFDKDKISVSITVKTFVRRFGMLKN